MGVVKVCVWMIVCEGENVWCWCDDVLEGMKVEARRGGRNWLRRLTEWNECVLCDVGDGEGFSVYEIFDNEVLCV